MYASYRIWGTPSVSLSGIGMYVVVHIGSMQIFEPGHLFAQTQRPLLRGELARRIELQRNQPAIL